MLEVKTGSNERHPMLNFTDLQDRPVARQYFRAVEEWKQEWENEVDIQDLLNANGDITYNTNKLFNTFLKPDDLLIETEVAARDEVLKLYE